MSKRVRTEGAAPRGYRNISIEFDLKVEGLGDFSHGRRMLGQSTGYKPDDPPRPGSVYLPYMICKDPRNQFLEACLDCLMMEQVFQVWYTTDFDMPYKPDLFPRFVDDLQRPGGGILRWKLAKAIPRSVLRAKYGSWQKVTLDFFSQDATDDNPNFGVWFRCLLDSGENKVYIRNVVMRGQVPTPTPTQ